MSILGKATPKATDNNMLLQTNYIPKLVVPQPDSKDQRCYIKYKISDTDKGVIRWAKDYEVNKIPLAQRAAFVKSRIAQIQAMLLSGYVSSKTLLKGEKDKERVRAIIDTLSIIDAVEYGMEEKRERNLKRIYDLEVKSKIFITWCRKNGFERFPAAQFKAEYISRFISYLKNTRKVTSRTVNNYIVDLATIVNVCVKNEFLSTNYFSNVKKEKVGIGKNWAYTPEQQKIMIKSMKEKHPHMLLLIQFMYYTLARPKDLANLKIGDIGRRHADQIYFPEDNTKEVMERNIIIPKQLQLIIAENKIMDYDPEWYLFGPDLVPSPKKHHSKRWGIRFKRCVLDKFPGMFDSNYTLYSWKHTGVVSLWAAGVNENSIQRQTGHRHRYSFEKYLKSLGLFKNDAILNQFPDLG